MSLGSNGAEGGKKEADREIEGGIVSDKALGTVPITVHSKWASRKLAGQSVGLKECSSPAVWRDSITAVACLEGCV